MLTKIVDDYILSVRFYCYTLEPIPWLVPETDVHIQHYLLYLCDLSTYQLIQS